MPVWKFSNIEFLKVDLEPCQSKKKLFPKIVIILIDTIYRTAEEGGGQF